MPSAHASSPAQPWLTPLTAPAGLVAAASAGALCAGGVTGETPDGPVLCPFLAVTGLPCPFCGVTRSLFALGQGDVTQSVAYTPLGSVIALVSAAILVTLAVAFRRRRPVAWPPALTAGFIAVVIVIWIVQLTGGS